MATQATTAQAQMQTQEQMAGVREPHESGLSPTSTTARPGVTLWLACSSPTYSFSSARISFDICVPLILVAAGLGGAVLTLRPASSLSEEHNGKRKQSWGGRGGRRRGGSRAG